MFKIKIRFHLRNVATRVANSVAITAIAVMISFPTAAQQQGDFSIGLNVLSGFYADDVIGVGIGPKIRYNVTDQIRLAGELDFSFGTKSESLATATFGFRDFSLYGHYLISIPDKPGMFAYPLVGLGIYRVSMEATVLGFTVVAEPESRTVATLGVGVEGSFDKYPNLMYSSEFRLKIHGGTHFIVAAGLAYRF